VAVFGAGGCLGGAIFGFLQRASSIFGTGLGGINTPKCICATGSSSKDLNRILYTSFKAAYAGEELFSLTNVKDEAYLVNSLKGNDAIIMGTSYQYEIRPITFGSFEKSPNDKTLEFYLDEKPVSWQRVEPVDD